MDGLIRRLCDSNCERLSHLAGSNESNIIQSSILKFCVFVVEGEESGYSVYSFRFEFTIAHRAVSGNPVWFAAIWRTISDIRSEREWFQGWIQPVVGHVTAGLNAEIHLELGDVKRSNSRNRWAH